MSFYQPSKKIWNKKHYMRIVRTAVMEGRYISKIGTSVYIPVAVSTLPYTVTTPRLSHCTSSYLISTYLITS